MVGARRYDEFGRIKKKFRGSDADKKAREEAALARLRGTSDAGVRSPFKTLTSRVSQGAQTVLVREACCHGRV